MDTPAQLTPTVTVPSTSVMPRLSQRLMPTMLAPTDIPEPTTVSMVTVDTLPPHTHTLPPHTDTAMDTPAQLTPMATMLYTSVMPRLSQRQMLTTGATTTMESQPTVHMLMELTGPTRTTTHTAAHLPTHTITKFNTQKSSCVSSNISGACK